MIPEEIKIEIRKRYVPLEDNKLHNTFNDAYIEAAEFGYSLSSKELEEKDKMILDLMDAAAAKDREKNEEIDRLKGLIEKLEEEIKGWQLYGRNIDEALNSGDGSYRP